MRVSVHGWRRLSAAAVVLGLALALPVSDTLGGPKQSKAFGKSLTEWMKLYWTWAITGEGDDHVGHVQFLPIPQGEVVEGSGTLDDPLILRGELDVTFKPGTAFALPVIVWVGETYDPDLDIPDDPYLDSSIFTDANVLVTIDGKRVIDSSVDDLRDFLYGPADFDPPLFYGEPSSYGSIGAIFAQGIGFVHQPLSKGTHTLRLAAELRIPQYDIHVIFVNEWTITVDPGSAGKQK